MSEPTILRARDAADAQEAIAHAFAHDLRLELRGGGSKAQIGAAMRVNQRLDLSALTGVVDYDPAELTLTARPGTTLAEIEALVGGQDQMLAFEPFDHGSMFGATAGAATLGGVLAANVSGSRRLSAGGARDHLLGFEAVSGSGETFKAGGRVVKNVTGYDLPKLMAGSWGTLAALTQVTVKVLPRPKTGATILIAGLSDQAAAQAMSQSMRVPAEVSGAAHLPAVATGGNATTALRIEGFGPSVRARQETLSALMSAHGPVEVLAPDESQAFWARVRLVSDLPEGVLWRLSTPPSEGWRLPLMLGDIGARWTYDWGGGLIWLSVSPGEDAHAPAVRAAAKTLGGHATLVRAPAELRARVSTFQPEAPVLAALSRRVKTAFDPKGLLNPARLWGQA